MLDWGSLNEFWSSVLPRRLSLYYRRRLLSLGWLDTFLGSWPGTWFFGVRVLLLLMKRYCKGSTSSLMRGVELCIVFWYILPGYDSSNHPIQPLSCWTARHLACSLFLVSGPLVGCIPLPATSCNVCWVSRKDGNRTKNTSGIHRRLFRL